MTDAGLKELTGLTELLYLELDFTRVTDTGMKDVMGFKKLWSLNLLGTKVTPAKVKDLKAALPRCRIYR